MEEAHNNSKNLPAEILLMIFRLADEMDEHNTAHKFALVCKDSKNPAQSVLYSSVAIKSFRKLQTFYKTVQHGSHLGEKVKTFTVHITLVPNIYTRNVLKFKLYDLLSKLLSDCLYNLEEFNSHSQPFYLPVLEPLQNSQLKKLKRLYAVESNLEDVEMTNYATCVVLMKDRIKEIKIVEGNSTLDAYRLLGKLNEFHELTILHIKIYTDKEIQILEYVLTACKSLKELSFYFSSYCCDIDSLLPKISATSISDLSFITPAFRIDRLQCNVEIQDGYKNLEYVMHKFPRLKYFTFNVGPKTNGGRAQLDRLILDQLLMYAHETKTFNVQNLHVNFGTISETMNKYWNMSDSLGRWDVNLVYANASRMRETCLIDISRSQDSSTFTINYRVPSQSDGYAKVITKNGKFIRSLKLETIKRDSLLHVITQCPYLQVLHIYCDIGNLAPLRIPSPKRLSLKKLHIDFRHYRDNTWLSQQMSLCWQELEELHLDGEFSRGLRKTPPLAISLKHTKIDRIVFQGVPSNWVIYLKAFKANDVDNCRYYLFNRQLKESTEEEYNDTRHDNHISICCLNIPEFKFIQK